MRRKSDKDVVKENIVFWILGCAGILLGLFCLLSPFLPSTPYEEYQEKEIIVSKIEKFFIVSGATHTDVVIIVADDNSKYIISGKYDGSELSESLPEGAGAQIKYDKNKVFPFLKYIKEMFVDGKPIVTHNNDKPVNWTLTLILSLIFMILGVSILYLCHFYIVRNRSLQMKRDARIAKKYGKH